MSEVKYSHTEQGDFQLDNRYYEQHYAFNYDANVQPFESPYFCNTPMEYFAPMYSLPSAAIDENYELDSLENSPSSSEGSAYSYDSDFGTLPSIPTRQGAISPPRQEVTLWPEASPFVSTESRRVKQEKLLGPNGKRAYKRKTFRPVKCIQMGLLSGLAFINSGRDGCSLRELYAFVVENFEGFQINVEAWKKSIRHSLCTHDDVYTKAPGDGNWMFKDKDLFMEKLHTYVMKHPDISTYGLKDPRTWNSIRYGTRGLPRVSISDEKATRKRRGSRDMLVCKRQAMMEDYKPLENWMSNDYHTEQLYTPQYCSNLLPMVQQQYAPSYHLPVLSASFCDGVLHPEPSTLAFNVEELVHQGYSYNPSEDFTVSNNNHFSDVNCRIVPFDGL